MEKRQIVTADPSALGLFGLAMVTLVASSQKLGWTSGTSLIIPWAIFLGAGAQLLACVLDSKRNNVFGTTAFGSYGFFWLGVGMSWMIQSNVFGEELDVLADPKQLTVAFVGYLIFTLFMTFTATGTSKVLFIIFVLIDFLFLGLSLNGLGILGKTGHILAAVSELLISIVSFYGSAAAVMNSHYQRKILPVGKAFGPLSKAIV